MREAPSVAWIIVVHHGGVVMAVDVGAPHVVDGVRMEGGGGSCR